MPVIMVEPITEQAQDYVKIHFNIEPWQWMENRFNVDQHYADFFREKMEEAGLIEGHDYRMDWM